MGAKILVLVVGFLFIAVNGFAADGDLIVEGSLKIQGIFITNVTGTNPTCPSGAGMAVVKKYVGRTCTGTGGCGNCTLNTAWGFADQYSCHYGVYDYEYGCIDTICTPTSWTEIICMGN
jgi:hypothetical protein